MVPSKFWTRVTGRLGAIDCIAFLAAALLFLAYGTASAATPLLGPPEPITIGIDVPRGVALGDLDGDRILDLIVTDSGADSISVGLGTGSGGFGAVIRFATGGPPWAVAAADVNADGRMDVVTANTNATVSVLLGDGAGALLPSTDYPSAPNAYRVVRVADLDASGSADLLLGTRIVGVLPGTGGGSFGAFRLLFENSQNVDVRAADLDGNGDLEILVAQKWYCAESQGGGCSVPIAGSVIVLNDDGTGTFPSWTILGSFTPYSDYWSADAADADGDGDLDVVGAGNSALWTFFNTGSGSFPSYVWSAAGTRPALLMGDVSNDGHVDAVAMDGRALVFLGTGSGDFAYHSESGQAVGAIHSGQLGDLNGDGFLDLVQQSWITNGVNVFMNHGPDVLAVRDVPATSELEVTIHSNPARGGVRASVFLPASAPALVEVVDVGGRVLARRSIAGGGWHALDLGDAVGGAAGVYFVRVRQRGASAVAKVIVAL